MNYVLSSMLLVLAQVRNIGGQHSLTWKWDGQATTEKSAYRGFRNQHRRHRTSGDRRNEQVILMLNVKWQVNGFSCEALSHITAPQNWHSVIKTLGTPSSKSTTSSFSIFLNFCPNWLKWYCPHFSVCVYWICSVCVPLCACCWWCSGPFPALTWQL